MDRGENEDENDENAEDMQQELHVLLRVVQEVNLNLMCIKSDEGDEIGVNTGSMVCPVARSMDRGENENENNGNAEVRQQLLLREEKIEGKEDCTSSTDITSCIVVKYCLL